MLQEPISRQQRDCDRSRIRAQMVRSRGGAAFDDQGGRRVAYPKQEHQVELDVVVVGAGFGGLYALHKLRSLSRRVRVCEAGGGLGGTWYWNRYPGAGCDIESLEYSYSFCDALQQEWKWPERYGSQPEILRYLNHVADRFELRRDIELNTRVRSATFDKRAGCWLIETDRGERLTASYCVMAVGNLSAPRIPDFKGLDCFKRSTYHTARWPETTVDFSNQRVGVIGTGSSGIQIIPHLATQAARLYVFQRTPHYSVPARNCPLDPGIERAHKATYGERRRAAYQTFFGVAGYPSPTKSALDDTADERQRVYEIRWQAGGTLNFFYAYNDLLIDKSANETAAEFVREKIRATVHDPVVAELLIPKDYPIGTKRLCLNTDYYETFNRPNVTLVDIKSAPLEEITSTGIRTRDAHYELDSIVFATGFDAMTGALLEIDIRGTGGLKLSDKWSAGPRTFLGLMVAGFPNLFIVTGPGSPGVKSQMVLTIEQHVDWIADCLEYARTHGISHIEAKPDAETKWVNHVKEVADATLYGSADSWYLGANIPGKPRVFMPYVGGIARYKEICDQVRLSGYEGLTLGK
jgi:cyclohexanone monooxygenase